MSEWHVEMLWRCASCSEKNLGRNTQCQRCGKPKTGREEYEMPSDTSQAAAVTDASLLGLATGGANWRCAFCGSDQRRRDGECAQCGAGREQGKDLGAEPQVAGAEAAQAAGVPAAGVAPGAVQLRPARRSLAWVAVLAAVVAVMFGGCVMVWARKTHAPPRPVSQPLARVTAPPYRDVAARLSGLRWEQVVAVDRYKVVPREGFEEAKPASAFEVKKNGQRVHHTDHVQDGTTTETYTETVPDGTRTETYTEHVACGQNCTPTPKTCSNVCTPGKNGFAKCNQVCSGGTPRCETKYCDQTRTRQVPQTRQVTRTRQVPHFKDVPRYQDWYSWKVWDWAPERQVRAEGETAATSWPTDEAVALNKGLAKGEQERASRRGAYHLRFACDGGEEYAVDVQDLDEFKRYAAATAFLLRVEGGRARVLEASGAAPAASASR